MTLAEPVQRETAPVGFRTPQPPKPEKIIQLVEWLASQPDIPQNLANTVVAGVWLQRVDGFRITEEDFLASGQYEELLDDHRACLAGLISDGENLLLAIKEFGIVIPPSAQAISEEAIRSALNSLHITFRCEHGPKNSAKTNEMISRLFDGPKP